MRTKTRARCNGGGGVPDRWLQVDDEVGVGGGGAVVVGVGSIHALLCEMFGGPVTLPRNHNFYLRR